MGYYITEQEIRDVAKEFGWVEEKAKDPTVLIFNRISDEGIGQQVNVWYGRMTVGTYLKHPKRGKSQLFRRNVDRKMLRSIFENPRTHTRVGYYTRDQYREEIRKW